MGRSILIASGKGGSGRSTFAIAMGITLARQGKKVCLLDLNFGLRNLDIYLGLEDKVIFDMGDIMAGVCKTEKAIVKHDRIEGLYLLESTQNKLIKGISDVHIKALCSQLRSEFDYVIIDGPSAVSSELALAASGAESAVLVFTPDPLSLRNGDAVDKRLSYWGVKSRCFVLNMVRPSEDDSLMPKMNDFTSLLGIPFAGIIPYDENIHLGNCAGRSVFAVEKSYIAKNMEDIIHRMLG